MDKKLLVPIFAVVLVFAGFKIFKIESQPPEETSAAELYRFMGKSASGIDPTKKIRADEAAEEIGKEIQILEKLLTKYNKLEKEALYPIESEGIWFIQSRLRGLISHLKKEMAEK